MRPCFYRDVGRVIHSTAFRLLEYKTQVFVNHEGDYYRTRLTHSLEVAQISRGVARILGLNEDLAETIALAHDLGHPPFGHSGEAVLDELMNDEGGFEHNFQSYRVVTELEERYQNFPGLNLSYEVLEGILKHETSYDAPKSVKDFKSVGDPTLEAQIVNFADEIAYVNHDLDDGIHWGMLSIDSLKEVPLWDETFREIDSKMPQAPQRIKRCRTISELIGILIDDLQKESRKRIEEKNIRTIDDVRKNGKGTVGFSDEIRKKTDEAKKFLFDHVYRYKDVAEMAKKAEVVIRKLFDVYVARPSEMTEKFRDRYKKEPKKRHIADYIAGMTDRFALAEYERLRG